MRIKYMVTTSFNYASLASVFLITSIGCGNPTGSSTGSVTTQPTQSTTPAVPAGWVNISRQWFSYSYPSTWQRIEITTATQPSVDAADPSQPQQNQVLVQFVPGYPNKSTIYDQCADADTYLTNFYTANFLPLATDPTKYPRTTVTWLFLPTIGGLLGGSVGTVSITYQASVGSSANYTVDLQAVPRADGLYLVGIWNPDYYAVPSFEKTFLSTLVLKSAALPHGANCNYLG